MSKAVQRLIKIEADAQGNPPDRIHLLSVGHWHTPWHGAFEHTSADLAEMVENFDGGIALVANNGKTEAQVNYGHAAGDKAAGWIYELFLDNNGDELWGKVRWTKAASQALQEEEYKYISPEWNPREFPWENPEIEGEFVENVFSGAALTNIPLFKKLKPIMASADAGGSDNNRNQHQGGAMDLTQLRVKKKDELSAEELAFLEQNKTDLTDEERTTFGFAETPAEPAAPAEPTEPATPTAEPAKPVQASTQHGMTAEQITQLQADAAAGRQAQQELLRSKLTASVTEHINRGAIKSDELESTVDMLMASSDDARKTQLDFISKLPSNQLLANTAGSVTAGIEASVEVTPEERQMADAFGLDPKAVEDFKKEQAQKGAN